MSADNLFWCWEQAIEPDKSEALMSYFRYNALIRSIAERYDETIEIAAAIFSALSPNNDYHGNLRDLETVLVAERSKLPFNQWTVATYGQNKLKAWKLASREIHPHESFTALKTLNFWRNITHPSDPVPVTIDGHMFWCWKGVAGGVKGDRKSNTVKLPGAKVTPKVYHEIAGEVRGLARALGLIPNQLQAVLWITWKRLHRRKYDEQGCFFPKDYEVAGLIKLGNAKKEKRETKEVHRTVLSQPRKETTQTLLPLQHAKMARRSSDGGRIRRTKSGSGQKKRAVHNHV